MWLIDSLDARRTKQGAGEHLQEPDLKLLLEQTFLIDTLSHEPPLKQHHCMKKPQKLINN